MAKRELPVSAGQELKLAIEGLNHQGEGVGRYQGLALFVPLTIPGETVMIKVTEIKRNFARGELLSIVEPSPHRVSPACPSFMLCGGSNLQHIEYPFQLELKTRLVEDSLTRIGKIKTTVLPALGMENPWRYRNKVAYQVQEENGRLKLGFFAEGSHRVISGHGCDLIDLDLQEVAEMITSVLNKYKATAFNWETGQGLVRHVVLRKGMATGQLMAVIVTSEEEFPDQHTMASAMVDGNASLVSLVRNINSSSARDILGEKNILLAGREVITEKIGGLEFEISANSFFQVNTAQAEVLFEAVKDYATLTGRERVLDVYCGAGAISLYLAREAGHVIGLEVVPEAVENAAANARRNLIENAEFICGRAEEKLPEMAKAGFRPDVVILDPPRKGCDSPTLKAVAEMEPQRIVYVSCDPASLARDLQFLEGQGYLVKEVQPVDMFPHTAHVECVSRLDRVEK